MWYVSVLSLCVSKLQPSFVSLRCPHRSPLFPRHSRPSFPQMNISVPVDPLEWQISQDTANSIVAWLANTVGAAESVLRVAAAGHDKRLFFKVVICLYILSALGRLVSGVTIAYAGLFLFCLYMIAENSQSISISMSRFLRQTNAATAEVDM